MGTESEAGRATVSLVVKAPLPGMVKTRLAVDVGDEVAARVFRLLVERQVRAVPEHMDLRIDWTPPEHGRLVKEWIRKTEPDRPIRFVEQDGGDLGRRLRSIVVDHFMRCGEPLVIMGGDCPGADSEVICRAVDLLPGSDCVLGPTEDGGYYLIGLNGPHVSCFDGIMWSTPQVLAGTRARIAEDGLSVATLPTLWDVDTHGDWQRAVATYGFPQSPA